MQEIGFTLYITNRYIFTPIYFLAVDKDSQIILVEIKKKIHIVKDLKVQILIGNNILPPERFAIDLKD